MNLKNNRKAMNGYIAIYNDKQIEVYAETSLEAQRKAAIALKVKEKSAYKVSVYLCEKDGQEVLQSTCI